MRHSIGGVFILRGEMMGKRWRCPCGIYRHDNCYVETQPNQPIAIALLSREIRRTLHRRLDGDGGAAGLAKARGERAAGEEEG